MADILVKRATVTGHKIERLVVGLHGLPERTIDRDTALAWLADGHSLVPVLDGRRQAALQRVEIDGGFAIRTDNQSIDEDLLPGLPRA